MKKSELAKELIESIVKNGDGEILVDLLTANQSNKFKITGTDDYNGFTIDVDIENIRAFKKSIK